MPQGDVKDQIDAMLSIGEDTGEPEPDPPVVDPPVDDPPVDPPEDPPKDDDPPVDPPVDDPPADPPADPPEPDPVTDPPEDPPAESVKEKELREENEKLRKQIDERHTPEPEPAPELEPAPEPDPIEEISFLGEGVDLDELIRDPVAFNKLLNKIHTAGVTSARGIQETTLRGIPDIVKSNITIQATLKKEVETFYKANEDLRVFPKVVGAVYEELAADNPDWTVAKTFEEVEKETRNRLELHKKATDPPADPPDPDPDPDPKGPKFAKVGGKREVRQKPGTDSLLSEIDEMNKNQ